MPMTRARIEAAGIVLARVIVAAVFVFAAWSKLTDPHSFAEAIANYHLVPDSVSSVAAAVLPVLEVVIALALVAGVNVRGAAMLAGAMLLVFAIAMITTIARGINLDCGCFGASAASQVNVGSVARNVVLALASIAISATRAISYRELLTGQAAPRHD